jgi:hypothetical protein
MTRGIPTGRYEETSRCCVCGSYNTSVFVQGDEHVLESSSAGYPLDSADPNI